MITVANLSITNNSILDIMNKCNELAAIASAQTITANSSANGALSTGNAYVNGIFSSLTLAVGTLRGGNVQSSNTLLISSNVAVGSSYLSVGNTVTSNTNANQVIDTYFSNNYRTSKYVVQITNLNGYQATEILLTHDGNNVYMTEYATLSTNGVQGTFQASLSANTLSLLFTPVIAVNTVEFERRSLSI